MERKDCCPVEKPDEECPCPAQMRMGYFLDEEYLELMSAKLVRPWQQVQLLPPVQLVRPEPEHLLPEQQVQLWLLSLIHI